MDAEEIVLRLNSPGGDFFDGITIKSLLESHPAKVTAKIDGLAASIASIIALSADEILMAKGAYIMIHNPTSSVIGGESKDFEKQAELLNKLTDSIASQYAQKMGIPTDEAKVLMDAETWFTAEEAIKANIANNIYDISDKVSANFNKQRFKSKIPNDVANRFFKQAENKENPQNKINNKQNNTMDKQNQALELDNKKLQEDLARAKEDLEKVKAGKESDIKSALEQDRNRQNEIRSIANKFNFTNLGEQACIAGASVAEFKNLILNQSKETWMNSLNCLDKSTQGTNEDNLLKQYNEAEKNGDNVRRIELAKLILKQKGKENK